MFGFLSYALALGMNRTILSVTWTYIFSYSFEAVIYRIHQVCSISRLDIWFSWFKNDRTIRIDMNSIDFLI